MAENQDNGSGEGGVRYDDSYTPEKNLETLLSARWDPSKLSAFMRASNASKGTTLDYSTRSRYEQRLGVDLSGVRIFRGDLAEEITRQHNAEALTIGDTGMILMRGSSTFGQGSAAGAALLAHELTHVAQARPSALARKPIERDLALDSVDATETEAEAVEHEELMQQLGMPGASRGGGASKKEQKNEKIRERVLELLEEDIRMSYWRVGIPPDF